MISLITTGRDDDYGGGFLNRLYTSISKNIENLEAFEIPFEYIVVEWNPERDYLTFNKMFENLFTEKNIKDIVVKKEAVAKEGLNLKKYYEYRSKNVGVRNSRYDNLIILNADIVITNKTMGIIKNLVVNGLDVMKYYRFRYRTIVDDELNIIRKDDTYAPQSPDAAICGFFSGDLMLLSKETFIQYGEGYDEVSSNHMYGGESGMDGEILWNMYNKGVRVEMFDEEYYHINHHYNNSTNKGGQYNMSGYKNKSDWGLINYDKKINGNIIEIQ